MRSAVVGSGPTGLYTAIALARRGHDVRVVDRDQGPRNDGSWNRRGVMQFHHPHTFRHQVVDALQAEMPEVWDELIAAGGVVATPPGQPGQVVALLCRRVVFERVLRSAAAAEPGVALVTGHVDEVVRERGRAVGVRVDGRRLNAELVVDASGRASRLTKAIRGSAEGGDCGAAYVSRQYELRPGAPAGPTNSPIGMSLSYAGYQTVVFLHDSRTFSVLISHAGADRRFKALRFPAVFEAAIRAIPSLAAWTDPNRSRPITPVLPGGRLYNNYRGQLDDAGQVAVNGMVSVGDAVCTTTPLAGRGVALSLMQARRLICVLDEHRRDFVSCSWAFDRWCAENIKPWFDDHVHSDAERVRRWSGQDVDHSRRLPSDLIVAAAEEHPELSAVVGPYSAMLALPSSLAAAEPRAREIYAGGWRPAVPAGPTGDELAEICADALPAAA